MNAGRKEVRERLIAAHQASVDARREMALAAEAARAAGMPMAAIAALLGFQTRKAVYDLIKRGR